MNLFGICSILPSFLQYSEVLFIIMRKDHPVLLDRLFSAMFTYLGELAYGISSFVEENPMHKEAIEELATARKIGYGFTGSEMAPFFANFCEIVPM
jgi:hypothetical protein